MGAARRKGPLARNRRNLAAALRRAGKPRNAGITPGKGCRTNLRPKAARDDEPDLTPLIDMVFILLIFFILAASFAVRGIDLDLPPAHSGQALSGRVVEIRLLRDGSFLCEGIPVARADIRAKLQSLVRDFRARPGQLVLKAAPDAPVEALVFIVDEVRMQGGEKLLIATAQPDEPGRP